MRRMRRVLGVLVWLLVLPGCDGADDEVVAPERTTSSAPGGGTMPVPGECRSPEPTSEAESPVVFVYFFCGSPTPPDEPVALARSVPTTANPVRAALGELLKGPTEAERRSGFFSAFSARSADVLKDVVVQSDGTAVVDFDEGFERITNVSATAQVYPTTRSLDDTLRQFPEVKTIAYRIEGSEERWCRLFEGGC